jgi:hypothetical protein
VAAASVACVLVWPLPVAATPAATCLSGRQSAVLVAYTRTGGLAGIRDGVTVYRGGRALVRQRSGAGTSIRLPCTRLRAIRNLLERARFSTLQPVYAPGNPVSDGFTETVTYRGRTVRVLTGATPPARFVRALNSLRRLVSGEQ